MSDIDKWLNVIDEGAKRQKEIDEKLSPSKLEIKYIVDYAHAIEKKVIYIDMASSLAHEGVIPFNQAQQIIDWQKKQLKRDIEYLKSYLFNEDN